MFLGNFLKKKAEIAEKKKAEFNRIDVEDMLDQQYSCKEISDELGITAEQVYRIKNAKDRRKIALQQRALNDLGGENPVTKAKQELEAARLKLEIERLKFEQQKLEAEREDFFAPEDIDPEGSPFEAILAAIATGYIQNLNKTPTTTTTPQINTTPAPPQEKEAIIENKGFTDEQVDGLIATLPEKVVDLIKKGRVSEKQARGFARMQGINEDLAIAAYNQIKNEISNNSGSDKQE